MNPEVPPSLPDPVVAALRGSLQAHQQISASALPLATVALVLLWLSVGPLPSPAWALPVWLAGMFALALCSKVLARRFRRQADSPQGLSRWHRISIATTALQGLGWGILGLLLYRSAPPDLHGFGLLLLVTIGAAGAMLVTALPAAAPVFLAAALLPCGIHLALLPGRPELLGAAALGFAFVTLSLAARGISARLRTAVEHCERVEAAMAASDMACRQAEASSRAGRDFITTMSHAIRTPMNGIIGLTQLLDRSMLDPRQRKWVDTLQGSARHLRQLVDDVLDLACIEAGRQELAEDDFSPKELVRTCCDLHRPAANRKGLTLTCEFPDDLSPELCGDAARLRQILVNLIGNAIDFSPSGEVRIRLSESAHPDAPTRRLEISIQDSGAGVSELQRASIFEPFGNARAQDREHHLDSGLGLAISRRLASLLQGRLILDPSPGPGACFRLEVPLRRAESNRPPAPGKAPALRFQGVRALLVEDSATNRLVGQAALEGLGIVCELADDGEQALRCLCERGYDLVLMDCQLPGQDGFEITRRWRAIEQAEGRTPIPVAAVTANVRPEDRRQAHQAGMNGFLAKPFGLDELAGLIAGLLPHRPRGPV